MKKLYIAGIVALSLGLSANAYAKDLNAIDVLVGDFSAIGSVNVKKLAANDLLSGAFDQNEGSLGEEYATLKAAGIDIKKDIDSAVIAVNDKGDGCAVIDASKDISEAMSKLAASDKISASSYKDITMYVDKDVSIAVLSAKRVVFCDKNLDIKASIDNAIAASPKTLKDRNSTLNSMYAMTSSSSEVRLAGKMSSSMKKSVASYKLDGEAGQSFNVSDIEAGAISISLAKGLDIQAVAKTKSDDIAKVGSSILTTTLDGLLSDPSLKEMGLEFLAKAVKVNADKKNIKGSIKLTKDQLNLLIGLAGMMAGAAK